MKESSIADLNLALKKKEFSSVELTKFFLERIGKYNHDLNAVITTSDEAALIEAEKADTRIAEGNAPDLCGIPILHKDIFCTKNVLTTCGSKMLANFRPPYNATVVENFNRSGLVTLGKTNMDEFAMGSSNETSYFGSVNNPWALDCVPGGSSGGSAASVAARLAPAATATDTGGSIRQPAALCGVTGIKPTYGSVSRWGMIAFASSLDQGGPIAKSAEDCALLLNCMASFDPLDSTSIQNTRPTYSERLNKTINGLKIGVPKEYFSEGLNSGTKNAVEKAIKTLEDLGSEIIELSLPNSSLSVPAYYVIAPAEASANLSRYDGIKYGYRCDNPKNLEDLYIRSRSEGFGEEVQRRIMIGNYCLSSGYYDAYYKKAQMVKELISQDFKNAFEKVDVLVGPTCPSPAFKHGTKNNNPVEMYLEDVYTIAVNLAGLPGMSIPCGRVDRKPVGMQIIGNYLNEAIMLQVAHQFQKHTTWHKESPEDFV
jgi:aspartyl-tRNA(Asn)/glutamyl-tRNA(Gln) amidotransferase subunit A